MDYVLDTLLQSLLSLVPCELAQVILVETDTRLFLAREVHRNANRIGASRARPQPSMRGTARSLMEILATKQSLLITNTVQEQEWVSFKGFFCVPGSAYRLLRPSEFLAFFVGDTRGHTFTHEHLRLAKSPCDSSGRSHSECATLRAGRNLSYRT